MVKTGTAKKRRVIFGAACSLDGFIAGPGHEVDWLYWSDEVAAISREVWSTVDTVLMGRKTYEVAVRSGTSSYPGVKNYVFSRTMRAASNADVEVVGEDAAKFVRRLAKQPGAGICVMGGGELARSLFVAGLIDEVGLNVHPVLLGAGIPMFPDIGRRIKLELVESRALAGGCVYIRYDVVH